jgi:LysM repeat protein
MSHPPPGRAAKHRALPRRVWLLAPLLLALALVAACGGGGDDEGEGDAPDATPTTIPTATPFAVAPMPTIVAGDDDAPAPRGEVTYLVEAGDSLSAIAERFETTVEAVMEANDLTDPTLIFVGQELTIPSETDEGGEAGDATSTSTPQPGGDSGGPGVMSYVVQPGDTALGIAIEFGVTLSALAEANDTTEQELSNINAGDELTLPRPR